MFSLYPYVWSYKPVYSPKMALKSLTKSEIRKSLKRGCMKLDQDNFTFKDFIANEI